MPHRREGYILLWVLLALLVVLLLAFLPIRLTVDVYHAEQTLLRIRLQIFRLHRQWLLKLLQTSGGRQLVVTGKDGLPRNVPTEKLRGGSLLHQLAIFRRADHARHFLLRHLHPERIDALLLLHAHDAAATALLTGAARSAAAFFPLRWRPFTRLRIQPDFFHDCTSLRGRCILRFRLGTILITTLMLLAALAAQRIQQTREA